MVTSPSSRLLARYGAAQAIATQWVHPRTAVPTRLEDGGLSHSAKAVAETTATLQGKREGMTRLLNPRSIAVVGGDEAAEVLRQCRAAGFSGDLFAVNPRRKEMAGLRCLDGVGDLPYPPDASFVAVPREDTVEVVAALAALGAGGIVCYASGFSEFDRRGELLEQALVAAAGDTPVVGPNCYGLINYLSGATLWPDRHGGTAVEQGVAIISQSGNLGLSMSLQQRGLDIAYLISVGNMASLGMHDYVLALLRDHRVRAIGLYLEGLTDVAAFAHACRCATESSIPIVVLKTGRSKHSARIALSHTGSLAGQNSHYEALFKRLGVGVVKDVPGFLESLKFLSIIGTLPGRRLASLSCSGGEASLVADLASDFNLNLPQPNAATARELHTVLGERVTVGNPLDYHTYIWGRFDAQVACFVAMMSSDYDIVLLILDYPPGEEETRPAWGITEAALIEAKRRTGARVALVATLPENLPATVRERLSAVGIAPMQGKLNCLKAIELAATIHPSGDDNNLLPRVPRSFAGATTTLDEWHSKQTLANYGLAVLPNRRASVAALPRAAAELGFPVTVKVLSADIAHKSDIGGVALGLDSEEAVCRAGTRMRNLGDQFLVERMAGDPIAELLVGVIVGPLFGAVLVLGAGGVNTEISRDSATIILPARRSTFLSALRELRLWPILQGYRGQPRADIDAVLDAVQAVADYALEHVDQLQELDVNPLFVFAEGKGAVAVDALIRTKIGERPQ